VASLPLKAHEWFSFESDTEERTYLFDVTWLESNWSCIFGNGCQGVLTGPAGDMVQGCCSYGAHFVDEADVKRVQKVAKKLTDDQWQFKKKGADGVIKRAKNGEVTTKLVKDACIFLNRPDFHRGPGCAIHVYAMDNDVSYIPLKPEVCWQLPIRREETTDDLGHVTTTISEWTRSHWGSGGKDFHWWCTESPDAFVGHERVVDGLKDELIALVGVEAYETVLAYLDARVVTRGVPVPHPAIRRKS
jgi:hypothetical protein